MMADRIKPVVGMKVFSLNVGNADHRKEQVLTEVVVTYVGRKYFTVQGENNWRGTRYYIDNWRDATGDNPHSQLYASEQEWLDEKEAKNLCAYIEKNFNYGRNQAGLSLDAIRRIAAIIEVSGVEKP